MKSLTSNLNSPSIIIGVLLLYTIVLVISFKPDEVIPVKSALVIHDIQLNLPPSKSSYSIDLDANGFVDFVFWFVHR
ncbi:MAG: hypothetical protein GY751_22060 [Bacteroidetes bacterium]|nr:hypothetical protein [Bacteroidota bacterium]